MAHDDHMAHIVLRIGTFSSVCDQCIKLEPKQGHQRMRGQEQMERRERVFWRRTLDLRDGAIIKGSFQKVEKQASTPPHHQERLHLFGAKGWSACRVGGCGRKVGNLEVWAAGPRNRHASVGAGL